MLEKILRRLHLVHLDKYPKSLKSLSRLKSQLEHFFLLTRSETIGSLLDIELTRKKSDKKIDPSYLEFLSIPMRKEKIQNLTITSSIIIYNFKLAAESDDDHNKSTTIMSLYVLTAPT